MYFCDAITSPLLCFPLFFCHLHLCLHALFGPAEDGSGDGKVSCYDFNFLFHLASGQLQLTHYSSNEIDFTESSLLVLIQSALFIKF